MKWIRFEEGFKSLHQTMAVSLVFFLVALIYLQLVPMALFGAVFAMSVLQNIYYLNVGKDLKMLPNKKNYRRFLIGTENNLILEFENGKIPIWNGTLTLSIQDAVIPTMEDKKHFSGIFNVEVPFAVGSKERVQINIPLKGRKRGRSRITRITIDVPHIFGEGSVMMELDEPVEVENLVYPKITPFTGHLSPSPFRPGEVEKRQSLFHDVFQPVGTRDYVPSDRFDQIHWKASARMQKLQTKEFMPVTAQSVMFILNAIEKQRATNDFEMKIEKLASYVDYCNRHDIPFSIVVNIRTFGTTPFIYLATGNGKIQYQKALVMLAQLSDRNAKIPYEVVLKNIDTQGLLPPTVVLITHEPERYQNFIGKWSRYNEVVIDSSYEGGVESETGAS